MLLYTHNEKSVAYAPQDKIKLEIYNKYCALCAAFEHYQYNKIRGCTPRTHLIAARLAGLYYIVSGMLQREVGKGLKQEEYNLIETAAKNKNCTIEDYYKAFDILAVYLDKKGITKIDTIADYDRTRVEHENEDMGL